MLRSNLKLTVLVSVALLLAVPAALLAGKEKREKRASKMPHFDLASYPILFIEDFQMTDPKASKRKKQGHVTAVPTRLPNAVLTHLEKDVFERFERAPGEDIAGAVILKADITRYKPGSQAARAMMIGTSNVHVDLQVHLIEAESGKRLLGFPVKRTFAWGGFYGASRGMLSVEDNVAQELAAYLRQCRQGEQ